MSASRTVRQSVDLDDYVEVYNRIKQKNNELIVNLTTGPGCNWIQSDEDPMMPGPGAQVFTAEKRLQHIEALRPEMCTLDICTMQIFGTVAINTKKMMTKMGHMIRDMGVKPEIEVFDTGDLVFAEDLIAEGALDGPGVYSIVMGTKYGIPADTRSDDLLQEPSAERRDLAGLRHLQTHLADGGAVGDPGRQRPHRLRGFHLPRPRQTGGLQRHHGDAGGRTGGASGLARSATAGEARQALGLAQ